MRCLMLLLSLLFLAPLAPTVSAGQGKVIKVLPLYLDLKGHDSLSPSLYERDAYQAILRKDPKRQSGLCFAIQWKATRVDWRKVKLRVEMRGVNGDKINSKELEMPVRKTGWLSTWTRLNFDGKAFHDLGKLQSWRATLWEGETLLGEQKSFLW